MDILPQEDDRGITRLAAIKFEREIGSNLFLNDFGG
jgi:hypothetical protein